MCNKKNNETKFISCSELIDAVENDKSESQFKANAELLINAINDFPVENLKNIHDFLNILKMEIGIPLTFEAIEKFQEKLSFGSSNETWKMESLSSVLEIFCFNKTKTLDEIAIEISAYYTKIQTR